MWALNRYAVKIKCYFFINDSLDVLTDWTVLLHAGKHVFAKGCMFLLTYAKGYMFFAKGINLFA